MYFVLDYSSAILSAFRAFAHHEKLSNSEEVVDLYVQTRHLPGPTYYYWFPGADISGLHLD